MRFPDGFLEDVRHAADIVSYVSEHVALKKMGTSWKGLCPFHGEKSPSFNVRPSPPVFHCFGCGEGGDIFKFAMLHERLPFPEAVEMLARKFGVPIPKGTFEAGPDRQFKDELFGVLEAAADHYQKSLWTPAGQKAREYLEGRGFDGTDAPRAGRTVILSESLARRLWPSGRAVGQRLAVDYSQAGTYPYQVVGVVNDVRFGGPRAAPRLEIYLPHAQRPYLVMNVAVRTKGDPRLLIASVREVLREIDPGKPAHADVRVAYPPGTTRSTRPCGLSVSSHRAPSGPVATVRMRSPASASSTSSPTTFSPSRTSRCSACPRRAPTNRLPFHSGKRSPV